MSTPQATPQGPAHETAPIPTGIVVGIDGTEQSNCA